MKKKKHIPVLLLALFFTIATNGVSVYEHFCPSGMPVIVSLFSAPNCGMEKAEAPCCAKKHAHVLIQKSKSCCEHKTFFKKFSYDGFTAKVMSFKISDLFQFIHSNISVEIHLPFLQNLFTGLSPPYPDYEIAQYLEPTQADLQVFIC